MKAARANTIEITAGMRIARHGGDLIMLKRAGTAIVAPLVPAPPSTSSARRHEQRGHADGVMKAANATDAGLAVRATVYVEFLGGFPVAAKQGMREIESQQWDGIWGSNPWPDGAKIAAGIPRTCSRNSRRGPEMARHLIAIDDADLIKIVRGELGAAKVKKRVPSRQCGWCGERLRGVRPGRKGKRAFCGSGCKRQYDQGAREVGAAAIDEGVQAAAAALKKVLSRRRPLRSARETKSGARKRAR